MNPSLLSGITEAVVEADETSDREDASWHQSIFLLDRGCYLRLNLNSRPFVKLPARIKEVSAFLWEDIPRLAITCGTLEVLYF